MARPAGRASRIITVAALLFAVVLTVFYRGPGDSTLTGEVLTIWPPELWAAAIAVVGIALAVVRRGLAIAVLGAVAVFLVLTSEWGSLLHGRPRVPRDPQTLRVVTWNVARSPDLASLARLAPDLCLFQENAPVERQAKGVAAWRDFRWAGTLDPAIFSRYAFDSVEMAPIGPWAPPQAVSCSCPDGRSSW